MRKLAVLVLVPTFFAASVRPARAASPWYGWQIMIADAMSLTFAAAGGEGAGIAIGLAGYSLGSPIIHIAHGDVVEGLGAGALRVGLPLGGIVAGVHGFTCTAHCDAPPLGAYIGVAAGVTAALVVDYVFLSRHERPERSPLSPGVALTPGGALFSLAGEF